MKKSLFLFVLIVCIVFTAALLVPSDKRKRNTLKEREYNQYSHLAKQGNIIATKKLFVHYQYGLRDYNKSVYWLHQAYKLKDKEIINLVENAKKNKPFWLQEAASSGNSWAKELLGDQEISSRAKYKNNPNR